MPIKISKTNCEFEREPLARPFGFKGGYLKTIWQSVALMESDEGHSGIGLGCQSVLWSDRRVFLSTSESGGNSLMFAITDKALQVAKGNSFNTPIGLIEQIFPVVYEYARHITGLSDLNKTFVLNALEPVDNSAWMLYYKQNNLNGFDEMIPDEYKPALSYRHPQVASIPIASYGMQMDEVRQLVEVDGYSVLKIKLGSPGSQQEMLSNDIERLEHIHKTIGDTRIPFSSNGKMPYYIDLNGRYKSKETLQKFLDHAVKIGAFEQIYLLEEPFPEEYEVHVHDLGLTVVADESAHTPENVTERIDMGYGAIALKPIVKTLSMTFKMAKIAHEKNIPCFCADLTVNPVMVDWNKNIAARLAPVPGMTIGMMETNGHQNYKNWEDMIGYHPMANATWVRSQKGIFHLDDSFYMHNGGIFEVPTHYRKLINH